LWNRSFWFKCQSLIPGFEKPGDSGKKEVNKQLAGETILHPKEMKIAPAQLQKELLSNIRIKKTEIF
jgi:hypothetical protein